MFSGSDVLDDFMVRAKKDASRLFPKVGGLEVTFTVSQDAAGSHVQNAQVPFLVRVFCWVEDIDYLLPVLANAAALGLWIWGGGMSSNKSLQRSGTHKVLGRGRPTEERTRALRARVLKGRRAALNWAVRRQRSQCDQFQDPWSMCWQRYWRFLLLLPACWLSPKYPQLVESVSELVGISLLPISLVLSFIGLFKSFRARSKLTFLALPVFVLALVVSIPPLKLARELLGCLGHCTVTFNASVADPPATH